MKGYITAILLLYSMFIRAQSPGETVEKKKSNPYSLNLIFTPQLFLHNLNLENDGIYPDPISTKNTGGFRAGLEIEKRSRRNGFIMDMGVTYGFEHQYIQIAYDNLVFYEPSSAEELLELGAFSSTHRLNTTYLDVHFNAGYIFPVHIYKGWRPVAKVGVFLRTYYQWYQKAPDIGILFEKNDTLYSDNISSGTVQFGAIQAYQEHWVGLMEFYAGITKNFRYRFLKNINIGIEVTRTLTNFKGNSAGGNVNVRSYTLYKKNNAALSSDNYLAKDIAIGLKLSAGLWHK